MTSLANLQSLEGRVAVVTGGAGHLGQSIGAVLAELNCRVCLVDRNIDVVREAAKAIAINPDDCLAVDLEREDERQVLVKSMSARFNTVDIVVNNAAFVGDSRMSGWAEPFAAQTLDSWRRAIEVNLTAPFHLIQMLSDPLKRSGRGSIINIGSIYGALGPDWSLYEGTAMANPAAYAASKGGLIQLTRWLATTMAPHVRVNSICPGGIERGQPDSFVERYVARTPLGRMGHEDDFRGVVAFLASDASRWVTGQNIMVDGGWSAW
jgi:NAD(P)-dependent dehydrogenase (short-subunit alcohol dehydrogenase family)